VPELSEVAEFWMNWAVQLAVALGTVGAVVVAVAGDYIRGKCFPPKLSIEIADSAGELTSMHLTYYDTATDTQIVRTEDARFYRLRVTNEQRWSPVKHAQGILVRIEKPAEDGRLISTWTSDVPIQWKHQTSIPAPRTIGPPSEIDLCAVVKGKWLQLNPLFKPLNIQDQYRGPTTLVLSVLVQADEYDTPVVRVKVSWDGGWHDGTHEMRDHFNIAILPN